MESKKSVFKSYAKQAKKRLASGYWDDIKRQRDAATDFASSQGKDVADVNALFRKKLTRQIFPKSGEEIADEKLYARICDIMSNAGGGIVNPVSILIDRDYIAGLDCAAKERYVMQFTKKIRELVNRYERESELKIS